MTKFRQIIFSIIFVVFVIFSWQIAENIINAKRLANNETGLEAFIPSPLTIIHTFTNSGGLIVNQSLYTFSKAILGFGIGILFAIFMAFLFLLIPWLRNITLPILFGINSFPIVGLAPAIVLAFGQGSFFQ